MVARTGHSQAFGDFVDVGFKACTPVNLFSGQLQTVGLGFSELTVCSFLPYFLLCQ